MADTPLRRRFRLSYTLTRSFFRFSLRSLLLGMFVVAVWCAFHANRGRYERSVERDLTLAGAKVDSGLDRVTGKPRAVTSYERFLRSLFAQRFVRRIEVRDKALAPELLDKVWRLPHLESVMLFDCHIRDEHLRSLGFGNWS
jgi:hypothetical protein